MWNRPFQIVIPSGVPPTLFFKDLSLRTYAASLINKSRSYLVGLVTSIVFARTLACFLKVCVGAICCSGIVDIWSKFAPKLFPQIKNIGPTVPQWIPESVQGGTPERLQTTCRQKKRATAGKVQATGSPMGTKIWQFDVFWLTFAQCFSASFFWWFLNGCFDHFGIFVK